MAAISFLLAALVGHSAAAAVPCWQRWEIALTNPKAYANPYADVDLRVEFTGPHGQNLRGRGFWNGGQTFKMRCAFVQLNCRSK